MNKRRRYAAKRRRHENKIIKDFHNKMRGQGHRDYYLVNL